MSARDEAAKALFDADFHEPETVGWSDQFESVREKYRLRADRLTAAGFSIVHKDEIHAPSVERCYDIACVEAGDCIEKANKAQAVGNTSHMYRHNTAFHAVSNVADALRELMKEVGRG